MKFLKTSPLRPSLLFVLSIIASSSSHQQQQLQVVCDFSIQLVLLWDSKEIYTCTVHSELEVLEPQTPISNISGTHLKNKENQKVHGFQIVDKNVKFFPKNVENSFYRLAVLTIENSKLSEIRQSDLTPFTNLKVLQLPLNFLKFLEQNLFTFNPKLEVVNLARNRIQHVHPDVFDQLKHLNFLGFEGNFCGNESKVGSAQVRSLVTNLKEKCGNFDYEKLFNVEKFENSTRAEILRLKKLNFESAQINQNLTKIVEDLRMKLEAKSLNLRLLFMAVLLGVLVILTFVIVGLVLYLVKQQKFLRPKVEPSEFNGLKLPAIPYNRSVAENIYEDIRPGRNEPGNEY